MHPVKQIENTSITDVVIDICQFDDALSTFSFLFFLFFNELSAGMMTFPLLSIRFALPQCFGEEEPIFLGWPKQTVLSVQKNTMQIVNHSLTPPYKVFDLAGIKALQQMIVS